MIYLISGTSRSGKTLVAKKIMQQYEIPYLSLDWLVMGFTNGIPEYGIHDKLWPNEIAEKFWDFLKAMLENMIWSETDYIIEGEAVLPELINDLLIIMSEAIILPETERCKAYHYVMHLPIFVLMSYSKSNVNQHY